MSARRFGSRAVDKLLGFERAELIKGCANPFGDWWRAYLTSTGRASSSILQKYHNKYRGQRGVIIGNGPSLRETDLSLLRGETTFGLNRINLLFQDMGFATTFLVCINDLVLQQVGPELAATTCRKFFRRESKDHIPERSREGIVFLQSRRCPRFSKDPRIGVWEGATVTFVALQLAHWMGFRTVLLVGVDHKFTSGGPPNSIVTSEGADPNHFSPTYFGKGFMWQLPDLDTSERAYRAARHVFERDGRSIVDCTVGGRLSVFPKSTLEREL